MARPRFRFATDPAALYREGRSVISIAREAACNRKTVLRALAEAGVERRRRARSRLAPADVQALYLSGVGVAEIARRAGVTEQAVYCSLRRRGTAMRPRGRPRKAG
jgi:DNA-binding phage protein